MDFCLQPFSVCFSLSFEVSLIEAQYNWNAYSKRNGF